LYQRTANERAFLSGKQIALFLKKEEKRGTKITSFSKKENKLLKSCYFTFFDCCKSFPLPAVRKNSSNKSVSPETIFRGGKSLYPLFVL
jgi:hypothetical protein